MLESVEAHRTAAIEHIKEKGFGNPESVQLIGEWREPLEKGIDEVSVPTEGRLARMQLDMETAVLYARAGMLEYALEMMEGALMEKVPENDERFNDIYEEMLILEDDLRQAVLGRQSESSQEE